MAMTLEQQQAIAMAEAAAAAEAAGAQAQGRNGVADQFSPTPEAPAGRSALESYARVQGLGMRAAQEGLAGGAMGLPAMIGDAFAGVGRDVAYGGKKLLSLTGAVDAPDPATYYPKGGEPGFDMGAIGAGDESRPSAMPASMAAARYAKAIPDAMGLPEPETTGEKVFVGAGSGTVSAMTGTALGRLGAASSVPTVAAAGSAMAANPAVQAVGGALGGAGATAGDEMLGEKGSLIGGVTGNLLPAIFARKPGKVFSGSAEGQERVAGEVLRRAAGDGMHAQTAIRELENSSPNIPGWQHFGSNASRSPGIAVLSERTRSFANTLDNGGTERLTRSNSSALSRALDSEGAGEGVADATRTNAQQRARAEIQGMDLNSQAPIDITNMLTDLRDASTTRGTGLRSADTTAASEIHGRLMQSAQPIMGTNSAGKTVVTGYEVNPRDMASIRADLSEARYPKNGVPSALPSVQLSKGRTRQFMDGIDDELDQTTGGGWNAYLDDTRSLRNEADNQDYMATIAQRGNSNGMRYDNGERVMNFGNVLKDTSPTMDSVPLGVAGNPRKVARERLDPRRQSLLSGIHEDLRVNNFVNSPGLKTAGSSTAQNLDLNDAIGSAVREGRSPGQKFLGAAGQAIGMGAGPAGRVGMVLGGGLVGAGAQFAARGIGSSIGDALSGGFERSATGVARNLGRAETSPAEMARLMRLDPVYRGSMRGSAARTAVRSGILGTNGYLTGDREASRYR